MALVAGCGPTAEQVELQRIATLVRSLQAQVARQDQRGEELSNRLIVMSHRMDNLRGTPRDQPSARRPAAEPPSLEVVKLTPAAPAPAPTEPAPEPPIEIRLVGGSGPPSLAVAEVPPPPEESRDQVGAEELFRAALEAYRAGSSDEAYERFAAFVARSPRHELADNALYWMGECRFERGQFQQALVELGKVVERHPNSNKAADALLKMGLAHEQLGRQSEARSIFKRVIATYPHSALAELARARLASGGAKRRMR